MQQTALCRMQKRTHLRKLCILVHDRKRHNVCFSQMAQAWLLENADDGLVSQHTSFASAINAMERAVGLNGSGYEWTVISNPYYSGD